MTNIHPTAVIDSGASIGKGVSIGPYCVVGPNVQLDDAVTLKAHVVVGIAWLWSNKDAGASG